MVLNHIDKKQREDRERAEREAADKLRQEHDREMLQQQQMLQQQREREQRERQEKKNINTVFEASGVLNDLKEIEKGRLQGTVNKHALVVNLETGIAELAWGNKFSVNDNSIGFQKVFLRGEFKDYQSIRVIVDPNSMDIRIVGQQTYHISKDEWQRNRDKVHEALADAYLNPNRIVKKLEEESHYDGGSYGYCSEC
jgi:hypothetical protein